MKMNISNDRRFIAEWETQDAILIAIPDQTTDWNYILDEVKDCYFNICKAIIEGNQKLIVLTSSISDAKSLLSSLNQDLIIYVEAIINDTWTRDYGFISVTEDQYMKALDFEFNGWGLKFASNRDNLINLKLLNNGIIPQNSYINYRDFTLEGGSLETDGKGTLLTTSECLCSQNRNGGKSKIEIEEILSKRLGINHFLWLDHGYLAGDDTDSHIDTLARMCPNDTILYVGCRNVDDEHFEELLKMRMQLSSFCTQTGNKYNLIELPLPDPIFDNEGERLPATYANYLVMNDRVLVPTYNQEQNDSEAINKIKLAFPNHEIIGIDCCVLIKQHGSLHCSTMQIPKGLLNI